jgi:hypothetical protein
MASPAYLEPYLQASRRFGAGFGSLLWASPKTQAARFRALVQSCDFNGRVILDAGCGRADLLDFLVARNIRPARYIGIEAIEPMAAAARIKLHPMSTIIRGDFVEDPNLLDQQAETVIFSGSLNTLSKNDFYTVLRAAWDLAGSGVIFNFLSSNALAKSQHLTWHRIEDVTQFARTLTDGIHVDDQYMDGDCTIAMQKSFNSLLEESTTSRRAAACDSTVPEDFPLSLR